MDVTLIKYDKHPGLMSRRLRLQGGARHGVRTYEKRLEKFGLITCTTKHLLFVSFFAADLCKIHFSSHRFNILAICWQECQMMMMMTSGSLICIQTCLRSLKLKIQQIVLLPEKQGCTQEKRDKTPSLPQVIVFFIL